MQLARVGSQALVLLVATGALAHAEDRAEVTTTWYQEQRQGGLGGLTVLHPQADLGVDFGDNVTLDLGYSADVVTGATAAVYAVDAVSSATEFSDLRHQGALGLTLRGARSSLALGVGIGRERDYLSLNFGGTASVDLPGRNTGLSISYSHSRDAACDKDNAMATPLERRPLTGDDPCAKGFWAGTDTAGMTQWRDISLDTLQGTLTQNLSPTLNMQLSLYGELQQGFLSNPYRRVRVGPVEAQEHQPDVRARTAVSLRVNRYLPALRAALHADARAYSDTWGVNAGTVEVAYSQAAGSRMRLRVRARVHQQTAATFFKDAFFYETESTAGAYFTGDRELAPLRNITLGAKLTLLSSAATNDDGDPVKVLGVFERMTFALRGDVMMFSEFAADDDDANPAGRDSQFLTSDQLLDAVIIMASARANF